VPDTTFDNAVISMIADTCQIDPRDIAPDGDLHYLGIDSMSLTAVISRLEMAYRCEFGAEQIVQLLQTQTVRQFTDRLGALVGAAGTPRDS
jgi:acyl carrier protein